MKREKSLVALVKGKDTQENVTKVFDLMGGVTNMIEENSTVILKPNAGHAAPIEYAVCTNPETVRAVIREVKKANPKRIIIAEAAAIGCDTMECFEVSGIAQVAREEEVELLDIKREKDLITIPVRGYRSNISHVKLPRVLVEAEHIINIPILKAHASMVFSCALKNIKGVVQDKVHMDMHRDNLTMAMMDVWYAARPDINIVDAMYAAGGFSPHTPVALEIDCIIGSYDPVATDRIACELVGIDTEKVDYFKVADQVGLGNTSMEDIILVGDKLEDCYKKLWVPYIGGMDSWPEYNILHENACSSCQALLASEMEQLRALGAYDKYAGMTIVIGRKDSIPEDIPPEKLVLHGNCTRKFKDRGYFIKGCPPAEATLHITVMDEKLYDASENIPYARARLEEEQPVWRSYVLEKAEEFYANNK